jgi:hypothetical protein
VHLISTEFAMPLISDFSDIYLYNTFAGVHDRSSAGLLLGPILVNIGLVRKRQESKENV